MGRIVMLVFVVMLLCWLGDCSALVDGEWSDPGLTVSTSAGAVVGLRRRSLDGRPYRVFRGVPYAEPPVGELRFRPPVAKAPWDGVLEAGLFGPSCPQDISAVSLYYPDYVVRIPEAAREISEDCLTLNVYSPVVGDEGSGDGRAVMVWIHGGSYETGQGSGYDASALAVRGGVVVVTLNYRLNVFGFLCTDDAAAPGNYGLLDQQLALRWVRDNIAAFGGDPERVTLFGQSAGGASASAHLTSPGSRPLFRRVLAHSGISPGALGLPPRPRSPSQLRRYAQRIASRAGCPESTSATGLAGSRRLIACLRQKPFRTVLAAGLAVAREELVPRVWLLSVDGRFYPTDSPTLARSYTFDRYDAVTGVTSGDGSPLLELLPGIIHRKQPQQRSNRSAIPGLSQEEFDAVLRVFYPDIGGDALARRAVSLQYGHGGNQMARLKGASDFLLDNNFLHGVAFFFGSFYRGAGSRRMFVFDHRTAAGGRYPWLSGAPHSEELSYVFGLPFNGSGLGHLFTEAERRLSDRMITYWSNIAKTGDPNINPDLNTTGPSGNLTYWPEYGDTETYLLLRLNGSTVGRGYRQDKVRFWTDYLPALSEAADQRCREKAEAEEEEEGVEEDGGGGHKTGGCGGPGDSPFGEGLGLQLTRQQAESVIEAFMFLVIALLACLILGVGAALGYRHRYRDARRAGIKEKAGTEIKGEINKLAAFEVNEGFNSESEDTKM